MKGVYGDRNWTDEQIDEMVDLLQQGRSDAKIGRRVGRSADAVKLKRQRLGVPSRRWLLLSAREVAKRMGVPCSKTVGRWIERGYIEARRGQWWGPNKRWYVTEEALYDFVGDPEHRHRWSEGRITDPLLRTHARDSHKPERYLTVGEVARLFWASPNTVNQWIRKGWLRAVRNGNWLVPESALVGFAPRPMGGRRAA
jgi:excisionase family DNA binding protein